ncbi:MAG: HU family DNA-binding protein [Anaerolineales bacterium]|nr:HU family DNA-binding protein [Anaerolineales bacterium]
MAKSKLTKSQFVQAVADKSGLSKKQAASVLAAMNVVVTAELKKASKKNPGEVTIPGLLKLTAVHKPKEPAKPGINPFTKEPIMIKEKPERKVVKARPIKALKDAVL